MKRSTDGCRLVRALVREAVAASTDQVEDDDCDESFGAGSNVKTEIVKRCRAGQGKKGKPWCLYSHKGKVLGHHPSAAAAYGQERAIKAHGG
jgi:hypothetical protein